MKKNIISVFIIVFFTIVLNYSKVYATSFADFDEEAAEKQNQEMIKEQENLHNVTEVKSSDNYLTDLQVEGYTLLPEFDKQTLEYSIKETVNNNEININAIPSNEKATIKGNGKIEIEEGKKEYRVDVISESGVVRTYTIILNEISNKEENTSQIETTKNEEITSKKVQTIQNEQHKENEQQKENIQLEKNETFFSKNYMYIIIAAIVILIIIIFMFMTKGKKKGKH